MKSPCSLMKSAFAISGISFALVNSAVAGPIDISGLVNADLTTYSGGSNYPPNGGPLPVGGIGFNLATIGPNNHTAVIQSSTTFGVTNSFTINIGQTGVTSVDTLMNSAFGACGTNIGELDFNGVSNSFVYVLTEGTNIRDHFNGFFCNTAPGVAATASFGGGADRLDMQAITLPAGFATDTLQTIVFKSYGEGGNGSPFLAALTIPGAPSAAPEPATLALLGAGLAGLSTIRRRRKPSSIAD